MAKVMVWRDERNLEMDAGGDGIEEGILRQELEPGRMQLPWKPYNEKKMSFSIQDSNFYIKVGPDHYDCYHFLRSLTKNFYMYFIYMV